MRTVSVGRIGTRPAAPAATPPLTSSWHMRRCCMDGHSTLPPARAATPSSSPDAVSASTPSTARAPACNVAQTAARAEGLDLRVVQADLESFPLPRSCYDVVITIRYLQRSLFEPMQQAVKPGGVILFETFLIDQQAVGHPRNPAFLLQHGELRAAFSSCDILTYEEGLFHSASQSAYLARMVARRRSRGVD